MYAHDDGGVVVINDRPQLVPGLRVEAQVLTCDGRVLQSENHDLDAAPISSTTLCHLRPAPEPGAYFVDLRLFAVDGRLVSRNFYWLASPMDVLDPANTDWNHTPAKAFADFTALRRLPRARLNVSVERLERFVDDATAELVRLELRNPTDHLAFFVQLRLVDGNGDDVLPVVWTDNYVSLLPGESMTVRGQLLAGTRAGPLALEVRGMNVDRQLLPI
jgi:exo-1,4-beta-D-glucosaminidase